MRILHVIPCLRKGGAERLVLDICKAQNQAGFTAEVITLQPGNQYESLSREVPLHLIPSRVVPSISGKGIFDTEAFDAYVDRFKPDVIHSHLFEAELVAHHRIKEGVVYASHLHDNMFQFRKFEWSDLLSKFRITCLYERRLILSKYARTKKLFIAISSDTESYFKKNLPPSLGRCVKKLNNGFDFHRFHHGERKAYTDSVMRLVTIGSFVPKKNQGFLIPVMKRLVDRGLAVHLDMLGDGPMWNEVKQAVTEAGLDSIITLHGNVADVASFLKAAYLYVHPAWYEPFGLVLLEAMAGGLPCICNDGRGNRDLIVQEKNGYILPENADLFADTIEQLIKRRDQWQTMSQYAIAYSKDFSIEHYVQRLQQLYLDAAIG